MKRFIKIMVNALACVLAAVCCLSFTACEDIKKMEWNVSVYDTTDKRVEATTMSIDLYRHVAPETVDSVMASVRNGYYDNTFFYMFEASGEGTSQIMIGNLKYVDGQIVQNEIDAPTIKGEFESNGVTASNLKNERGSIGIWRSWYASDTNTYKTSSDARNSGSATLFMPTAGLTNYDGYFAVFAKYDYADDTENNDALNNLISIFGNAENYENYVVYYTGTYSEAGKNNGLEFHCVTRAEYETAGEIEGLFEAEGQQLVCYNPHVIKVPVVNKNNASKKAIGAIINTAVIK